MRSTGKTVLALGLMLLLGGALAAGQNAGHARAKAKTLHKRGKVEAGVEGGCLLVRDTKDYKLYHVIFAKGEKPKAGDEISFSGTLHDGPTTCMEGIPVNVDSWKLIKAGKPEPKAIGVSRVAEPRQSGL